MNRFITVTGTGVVSATPDIANIRLGVDTKNSSCSVALQLNTESIQKLYKALESLDINSKDIKTSNVCLVPYHVWVEAKRQQEQVGWTISNHVIVIIRDLTKVGSVITRAIASGANTLHSLSFTNSNLNNLLDQARSKAMEDAIRKADIYCKAAFSKRGPIHSMEEQIDTGFGRGETMQLCSMGARAEAEEVPISEGSQDHRIDITAKFCIRK